MGHWVQIFLKIEKEFFLVGAFTLVKKSEKLFNIIS